MSQTAAYTHVEVNPLCCVCGLLSTYIHSLPFEVKHGGLEYIPAAGYS